MKAYSTKNPAQDKDLSRSLVANLVRTIMGRSGPSDMSYGAYLAAAAASLSMVAVFATIVFAGMVGAFGQSILLSVGLDATTSAIGSAMSNAVAVNITMAMVGLGAMSTAAAYAVGRLGFGLDRRVALAA